MSHALSQKILFSSKDNYGKGISFGGVNSKRNLKNIEKYKEFFKEKKIKSKSDSKSLQMVTAAIK